jgi:hypothetical protein
MCEQRVSAMCTAGMPRSRSVALEGHLVGCLYNVVKGNMWCRSQLLGEKSLLFVGAMPVNISKVLWSKCNFLFLAQLYANKLALCMTERGERNGNIFPYLLV